MVLNAFTEGLLLILLGIVCYTVGAVLKVSPLNDVGQLLVPLGVGYMSGNAVQKMNGNNEGEKK